MLFLSGEKCTSFRQTSSASTSCTFHHSEKEKILPLRVAPRKRDLGRIKDTVLRSAIGEYFQTSVPAIAYIFFAYRVCTYILRPSAHFSGTMRPPQQLKQPKGNTSQQKIPPWLCLLLLGENNYSPHKKDSLNVTIFIGGDIAHAGSSVILIVMSY